MFLGSQEDAGGALSDPTPSLGDFITQWLGSGASWWKKLLLIWGTVVFTCAFSCTHLCHCCGLCLQHSGTTATGGIPGLVKPLPDPSGHTQNRGSREVVRAGHEGWGAGEGG